MALLRSKDSTEPQMFRAFCNEITLLTAYEALRDLPTERVAIETPITTDECSTAHQTAAGRGRRHPPGRV